MPKRIDLIGQTFDHLTVIARAENYKFGEARWVCRCSCGNIVVVRGGSLRSGNTRSCGCMHKEIHHGSSSNSSTGHIGVYFIQRRKKYVAMIKDKCVAYSDDVNVCIAAREKAVQEMLNKKSGE